jgi:hypothetical protein
MIWVETGFDSHDDQSVEEHPGRTWMSTGRLCLGDPTGVIELTPTAGQ